jgi:hypothetical protein
MRVVRFMRERGLGNSVTQLQHQLTEQHTEKWQQQVLQYLTCWEPFLAKGMLTATPPAPMSRLAVPRPPWFLNVFVRDVLQRLEELKAKSTSVFGKILKMDSTKKVHNWQKFNAYVVL